MSDAYILLEVAAEWEGLPYNTLVQRMKRNPNDYKTKLQPRESGKPKTLVAVSSLSAKGRRMYRAERREKTMKGEDIVIETLENQELPWYAETDYHWFREKYADRFADGERMAVMMREFTDYSGTDRTEFAERFASEHGITVRTLYRMSQNYLNASAWALKFERDTGRNHDFFRVMAMCRKPKDSGQFPSLDPEVKAQIENIWFDKVFRANKNTKQMLYDKLQDNCTDSDIPCHAPADRRRRADAGQAA